MTERQYLLGALATGRLPQRAPGAQALAMGRAAGLAGLEPLVRELLSQHPAA